MPLLNSLLLTLNKTHRSQFLHYYVLCFAICYLLLLQGGHLLHQARPLFFVNQLDLSLNLLLLTDINNKVIGSYATQLTMDLLFCILPLLLMIAVIRRHKLQYALAMANVVFNLVYILVLTSLTPLSIKWFIGWVFIPAIFIVKSDRSFYFALHALRNIFLLFFFSAGLWKIRTGGLFNLEQMSGILLKQHSYYLIAESANCYSRFIMFLVKHVHISYALFLAGVLAEFSFAVGFFTTKFDRKLIIIFLLFIVFNFILLKINYVSWAAFLGCLWLSGLQEPTPPQRR